MADLARDSDCPICYQRYDRAGRAPRRLQCAHTLCTCCLGEMLLTFCSRLGSPLTCPFCRAPTILACTHHQATSLPLDLGLWERLGTGPDPEEEEGEPGSATRTPEDSATLPAAGKLKPWRALKKLIRKADSRTHGRRSRRQGIEHDDFRDIAMMMCFLV